jgi:uncharacterized coiled-coil protein SlyX
LVIYEFGENLDIIIEQRKRIDVLEEKYAFVEKPYVEAVEKLNIQMSDMRQEMDSMRKSQEQKDQQVEKY